MVRVQKCSYGGSEWFARSLRTSASIEPLSPGIQFPPHVVAGPVLAAFIHQVIQRAKERIKRHHSLTNLYWKEACCEGKGFAMRREQMLVLLERKRLGKLPLRSVPSGLLPTASQIDTIAALHG